MIWGQNKALCCLLVLVGGIVFAQATPNPTMTSAVVMDRFRNFLRAPTRYPVILIPGDGGSQLEAKLNKPTTLHYFCEKKTSDYFSLWVNLELMVPYVIDCWVDNVRLVYNRTTRKTTSPPGVSIRVPGWGNTTNIEYLDPTQLSPNELGSFFADYKLLVEDTFEKNSGKKVVLVCHSMGCPNTRYFLAEQTQAWRDKYIRAFISMGGAWAGSVKSLKAFASGENLGVVVVNPITVRPEQRSPSSAYLTPNERMWRPDEVLVETLTKNYTIADYKEFFTDIGFPDGYEMIQDSRPFALDERPPGVEVHCLHGFGVPTIDKLHYAKAGFPDIQPTLVYGEGDGTVNIRSLTACKYFANNQKEKVFVKAYNNTEHVAILFNKDVINYIKNVVIGS